MVFEDVPIEDASGTLDGKPELSFLSDDAFDIPQKSIAIHHCRLRILQDPFLSDHALRIDEKESSDGRHQGFVKNSIAPDHLPFDEVAEQRIG